MGRKGGQQSCTFEKLAIAINSIKKKDKERDYLTTLCILHIRSLKQIPIFFSLTAVDRISSHTHFLEIRFILKHREKHITKTCVISIRFKDIILKTTPKTITVIL